MTARPIPIPAQIRWAEGQARQHARIASRAPANSAARARAEDQQRMAEATVSTLRVRAHVFPQSETP